MQSFLGSGIFLYLCQTNNFIVFHPTVGVFVCRQPTKQPLDLEGIELCQNAIMGHIFYFSDPKPLFQFFDAISYMA